MLDHTTLQDITALVAALGALVAAIGTLINRKKIGQVHVLVNSRMTDVQKRVTELTAILDDHGVPIPPVGSIPVAVPQKPEGK